MFDATASTDRLIELILQEDKEVLRNLLTTDKVVATRKDEIYLGKRRSQAERRVAAEREKKAFEESRKKAEAVVKGLEKEIANLEEKSKADPKDKGLKQSLGQKRKKLVAAKKQADPKRKPPKSSSGGVQTAKLAGPQIFARVSRRSFGGGSMKPERILATVPRNQRRGLLTHPSWLVSHSDAMDNHAILRGRWIRERLLGGGIPGVPITVDAQLPDEPKSTLRHRMRVTREQQCWRCHQKMDPLGFPFEIYDDFGRFRTEENIEHPENLVKEARRGETNEFGAALPVYKTLPVNAKGVLQGTGDRKIDGEVKDAFDLIDRLAKSEKVRQSIIRYAFRYFTGRNETLSDSKTLIDADKAYLDSKGSFDEVIVSLLTSDSFIYRKRNTRE